MTRPTDEKESKTPDVMEIAHWWAAQPLYAANKTIRQDAGLMARELVRLHAVSATRAMEADALSYEDGVCLGIKVVRDFQANLRKRSTKEDDSVAAIIEFMDGIIENIELLSVALKLERIPGPATRAADRHAKGSA